MLLYHPNVLLLCNKLKSNGGGRQVQKEKPQQLSDCFKMRWHQPGGFPSGFSQAPTAWTPTSAAELHKQLSARRVLIPPARAKHHHLSHARYPG